MDKEKFSEYLEKRYYPQIKWYSGKSATNKKRFQGLIAIVTIFSVLTPILLLTENSTLKYLAIGFSAVVAVATTFSRAFSYQENWINYRTISETLKKKSTIIMQNLLNMRILMTLKHYLYRE